MAACALLIIITFDLKGLICRLEVDEMKGKDGFWLLFFLQVILLGYFYVVLGSQIIIPNPHPTSNPNLVSLY